MKSFLAHTGAASASALLFAAAFAGAAGPMRQADPSVAADVPPALDPPPAALAYPWPVKPFDRPHPVRGNFGDPRTIFPELTSAGGPGTEGSFSFHNGVDISARAGTPVYAVVSGVAHRRSGDEVVVHSPGERTFQYFHIAPVVREGEHVTARYTVLGYVLASAKHVHLTEIRYERTQNPLAPGHLSPYTDTTKPIVRAILFRNPEDAKGLSPRGLSGEVEIAADAFDRPQLPAPKPWRGLPVSPALVTWKITDPHGGVVAKGVAADFRTTGLGNRVFWNVYAAGTYQNFPVIGHHFFYGRPGRYLFLLTAVPFDTAVLPDGRYIVTVTAADVAGNEGSRSADFSIRNRRHHDDYDH